MAKYNDIDMSKWKEYEDVLTDSLWIFNKRDNSGVHTAGYHGNFVPQIPNQLFKRYTKKAIGYSTHFPVVVLHLLKHKD